MEKVIRNESKDLSSDGKTRWMANRSNDRLDQKK